MFTGLVETKGALVRRTEHGRDARLVLRGELVDPARRDPIALGESIAVDGVCLTVAHIAEPGGPGATVFEVDASTETLAKTTLGGLLIGAPVNLERALAIGGRLGGHIVSGHVDGVGTVVERIPTGGALKVVFEAPPELARYIAPKGSICVSGVSLTVNGVSGPGAGEPHPAEAAPGPPPAARFDVMLIPHTRDKTSLDGLAVGARVNLEIDILARYVARLFDTSASGAASEPSPDSRLLERLRASGYV